MLSNITSNSSKETLITPGDLVYLYGDTNYRGKLIRPVERTDPPKWSVALNRGGYEAVNVKDISVVEPQPINLPNSDLDLPFSDTLQSDVAELQQEIAALKQENARLQQESELVKKDLDHAKQIIRRAKDISPLIRISLKRVLRLAHEACMDVQRTVGGWILRMGDQARKFRRLADIWDLLSVDEFVLSEIFAEDKLISIELIRPPKKRKKPEPLEKTTFPLMCPEDVMRNRTMYRVLSG